jgi:hypothetical protein
MSMKLNDIPLGGPLPPGVSEFEFATLAEANAFRQGLHHDRPGDLASSDPVYRRGKHVVRVDPSGEEDEPAEGLSDEQRLLDICKRYFARFESVRAAHIDEDHFYIWGKKGSWTVTLEGSEDGTEEKSASLAKAARRVPEKVKDHWNVLECCLRALADNRWSAERISQVTTDGDNHDCEALFAFEGRAYFLKVR